MDLDRALTISAAGMRAQSARLRVVAENIANRESTGTTPGAEAYRRKTVTFGNRLDRALGTETVRVSRVGRDRSEMPTRFDPSHPAADANGYVSLPNVDSMVETMDMREAQRSYNANLAVLDITRGMLSRAIESLR
ncbi:flagellar basal-body rod protein FlgC [Humitalea rosea]|uniref:Flagellar basal-body rod protein FlgC n=1 Tax=Humitalea rosea TaxID=990373 RepID=A0A2W7I4Z4_9PROT|nr:flagellar basal body rod protein FlgC [Humitalea rosea]PZW41308.1 flagellar basal-body rod protein FlgC [Humitalea rosea]